MNLMNVWQPMAFVPIFGFMALSCGSSGKQDEDKTVIVMSEDDFAEAYIGTSFAEYRWGDGTVEWRRDEADVLAEITVDPRGGVLVDGLSNCDSLRLEMDSKTIPHQSCGVGPLRYEKDGVEYVPRMYVTGSWELVEDRFTIDFVEHFVIDVKGREEAMNEYQVVFTGTAGRVSADCAGDGAVCLDDSGVDGVSQCSTNADCTIDAECRSGSCLPHLSCDWANGSDQSEYMGALWSQCEDGREYGGTCRRDNTWSEWNCECEVNQVVVDTFAWPDAPFTKTTVHRMFNDQCGWLVPELSGF